MRKAFPKQRLKHALVEKHQPSHLESISSMRLWSTTSFLASKELDALPCLEPCTVTTDTAVNYKEAQPQPTDGASRAVILHCRGALHW